MGFIISGKVDTPLFIKLSKSYYMFNYNFFINSESNKIIRDIINDGGISEVRVHSLRQVSSVLNPFTVLALIYYGVDVSGIPLLKNYYYLTKLTDKKKIEDFFVNSCSTFSTVFVLFKLSNNAHHILFNHIPYIEKIVVKNTPKNGVVKFKNQLINIHGVNFISVSNSSELKDYLSFSGLVTNTKTLSENINAPYNTWFTYVNGVGVYNTFNEETRHLLQILVTDDSIECEPFDMNFIDNAKNGFTLISDSKLFIEKDDGVECFRVDDWSFLNYLSHRQKKRLFNSNQSRDWRFLKYYPHINIIR